MGKGAPQAPNPVNTIQQQTSSNRETAITNAGLGMVNQTDALGNKLTYAQEGSWADGTPRYTSTQTLSGPSQQLLNTGQQTQQNLANLAQEQSGRLSGLLNKPLDWSAQQNYLNDLTAQNLNPQWDRMAEQNEQSLVNRGLRPGSTAYNNAADEFRQSRSNAFNNANLNNFGTALSSQLQLRNQPLNEILALSGGSQLQSPQFTNTPTAQMAGTDVGGIVNQGYANQMSEYNSQQKGLGGLFDAGLGLLKLSDRRAKTDVVRVGQTDAGTPIYRYRYVSGGPSELGFIAQDLIDTQPDTVAMGSDGLYRVFYDEVV